ncbi:MAG: hypothetical protein KatS3mg108_1510 [Isosphaeraceae bacterium]|jgi:hypothetical protein|nr:MAG: hypothetical protein KatS3mg108_1510 [Isosphaeraceae bacterium]
MSTDAKERAASSPSVPPRGIRIFTYPKTIFIVPTLVAAIISAIIMAATGNDTSDPKREAIRAQKEAAAAAKAGEAAAGTAPSSEPTPAQAPVRRFTRPQNIAGMLFLTVFLLNLVILSIDFPRFTIIAVVLGAVAVVFLALYLNVYFNILPPLVNLLENVYAVANAQFYVLVATIILFILGLIWVTRYLDYWVILPNEILHNHGPFSDLERFPTMNLKFDKEIPDILEYALLGSGRLVLHVYGHPTAFVLDNVLWIDRKENELKQIMSRLEVRVTTDQEADRIGR